MSEQKRYANQLDRLFSRVVEELQGTSDEEILAGESPEAVKQRGLARLQQARAVVGTERLAAARVALSASGIGRVAPSVPIEVARAHIRQALNDSRYTLAARQLGEMSDDDILSVYAQLLELEASKPGSDDQ